MGATAGSQHSPVARLVVVDEPEMKDDLCE
jgi:hypothetical protein